MGDRRGAYKVLMGRPEGKIPPERLRHRWEDSITTDLQEDGWWAWTRHFSGQRQVVDSYECGNEPSGPI
jgi:hypothetical protein